MRCAQSLASAKRDASLDGRLACIIDTLTADVYAYTCLGLFERHKLLFSFQLAVKTLGAGPNPLDPQVCVRGTSAAAWRCTCARMLVRLCATARLLC